MAHSSKEQLWYVPAGTYSVDIVKVEDSVSKSGEWGMVNVRFKVTAPEEHEGAMFHHRFFVSSTAGNPNAEKGLLAIKRLIFAATGKNGDVWGDNLLDCSLIVSVKLEENKPKADGSGFWNPSNILTDIKPLKAEKKSPPMSTNAPESHDADMDDELPF